MKEVDLGYAQAAEGFIQLPAQFVGCALAALGRNIERIGHGAKSLAENILALVIAIKGRGIEVVDPEFTGFADRTDRFLLGGAEAHAAETDRRDMLACLAEGFVDHESYFPSMTLVRGVFGFERVIPAGGLKAAVDAIAVFAAFLHAPLPEHGQGQFPRVS